MAVTPDQWGFDVEPLTAVRAKVVEAIKSADLAEYLAAWSQYAALADAQTEASPDPRARIGLLLAMADVWREAKDRVRYWEDLHDAYLYAQSLGVKLDTSTLDRASRSQSFRAEFYQATRRYEEAIDQYIEREQDECLTNTERGLVNLRLAECYRELMEQANPADSSELREHFDASIGSALGYLKNRPEQIRALRLLEEYE